MATLWKVELRSVPTNWNAAIAVTAIRAAINPYSIAVAPPSFSHSVVSVVEIPPVALDLKRQATDGGTARRLNLRDRDVDAHVLGAWIEPAIRPPASISISP